MTEPNAPTPAGDTAALTVEQATAELAEPAQTTDVVSAQLADEDEAPESLNPRQASERLRAFREAQAEKQKAYRQALGEEIPPEPVSETVDDQAAEQGWQEDALQERLSAEDVEGTASFVEQAQYQLNQCQHVIQQEWARRFGDIDLQSDPNALQRLATIDPVRAQEASLFLQQSHAAIANVQSQAIIQQHNHANLFAQWAHTQDMQFLHKHPELKNEQAKQMLREHALGVLRDTGYSDEQIAAIWNDPKYRRVEMQDFLLKLARVRMNEAKAKDARANKPLPPVIRPGALSGGMTAKQAHVDKLAQKLGKSGKIRDAANLYLARKGG